MMFRDDGFWDAKLVRLWRTGAQPSRILFARFVRWLRSPCLENVVNSEGIVPVERGLSSAYGVAAVANAGAAAEEVTGAVTRRTLS